MRAGRQAGNTVLSWDFETALSNVAVHETGHTLGLVGKLLYGTAGWHNQVNAYMDVGWIMNRGKTASFMDTFGKSPILKTWKPRNYEYLRFILPRN